VFENIKYAFDDKSITFTVYHQFTGKDP